MEDLNKGVKTDAQSALAEEGVKTDASQAPAEEKVVAEAMIQTLEQELSEVQKEKEKIAKDKENYRTAFLKLKKGESGDEPDEAASTEERLRAIVREEVLNSKEAQLKEQQAKVIADLIRENKELKTAKKNAPPVNKASSGGSQDKAESVNAGEYFSPEQKKALLARNPHWDEKMIKKLEENIRRQRGV